MRDGTQGGHSRVQSRIGPPLSLTFTNRRETRLRGLVYARPLIAANPPADPGRRQESICTFLAKGDLGVSQADGVPYSRLRRNQKLLNRFT